MLNTYSREATENFLNGPGHCTSCSTVYFLNAMLGIYCFFKKHGLYEPTRHQLQANPMQFHQLHGEFQSTNMCILAAYILIQLRPCHLARVPQMYIFSSTKYISQTHCPLASYFSTCKVGEVLAKWAYIFLHSTTWLKMHSLPQVWPMTTSPNTQAGIHIPGQSSIFTSLTEWMQKLKMTGKWVL